MKYSEVLNLPTRTRIVLNDSSYDYTIENITQRNSRIAILLDHKNYQEQFWTGTGANPYAFDLAHRGHPPVNNDKTSRTKRFLVHLVDNDGNQTGEAMLVMPKAILGLESQALPRWTAEAQTQALLEAEQARVDTLKTNARMLAITKKEGLEKSIERTLGALRIGAESTFRHSLYTDSVLNEDKTKATPKVTGDITMTLDIYLRLMEKVFEAEDAQ